MTQQYKIMITDTSRFLGIPYYVRTYRPRKVFDTYDACIKAYYQYISIYDIPNAELEISLFPSEEVVLTAQRI